MGTDTGVTPSLWTATHDLPTTPKLDTDLTVDVCIVGGGISGLTTAYLLAGEGKRVAVLDDGAMGGGDTCRTSAHLSNALDDYYHNLERLHGGKGARLAAESHTWAIDSIERMVHEEGIDCGFRRVDGYLLGESKLLDRELEAAQDAGIDVSRVAGPPLEGFDFGPALRFPRQAQFHPTQYIQGLAEAARRRGAQLFTASKAERFENATVFTARGHQVSCSHLVLATNAVAGELVATTIKIGAYRSYCVALRIEPGSLPDFLLWDSEDPYHYVRVAEDMLVVGGEDHRTGQADDQEQRFHRLAAWARARFPQAGEVVYGWSGQVLEPADGLAYIGLYEPNVYVVTADSGHGLTHGTLGARLIADQILGRENPWAPLYNPKRTSLRALGTLIQENLGSAWQYRDHLTPGDVDSIEEIKPGCGAIVRVGVHQQAVYRQTDGTYLRRSAVCPHLGGVVRWNDLEKSWDCPCHGSRFAPDGHVLNGPALGGLEEVKD